MALTNTVKTRILLRNDTAANWASSTLILAKGEVAIDSTNGLMRMGTGAADCTWANALPIGVDMSQISTYIQNISKEYQLTSAGDNAWQLQERELSGGSWRDVAGSLISVDFTAVNDALSDLSANDSFLSGIVDDISATLTAVSSDYVKATDFAALSNEIGLSAASASNKVVTLSDIADLAGAMHFRGAVTPTEGQSDADAIAAYYTAQSLTPEAGDIVIITTNSKEYVYSGSAWVELGDESLYATKAELGEAIDDLSATTDALVSTVSAETLVSANSYTDAAVAALSADRYALSADVTALVQTVSADTFDAANDYTDEQISALSIDTYIKKGEVVQSDLSGFYVFDCGAAELRTGEPEA